MHDDETGLTTLSATEAAARLRSGALSAEAFAQACLTRVAERDAEVRAWVSIEPAQVLAQARALDARFAGSAAPGLLHGVPVGIKDVINTFDLPTQHNSPLRRGERPGVDAACVRLLRAAGALIFGKTDTVEFAATGARAATRNPHVAPHAPARTPGGSSSGSAAAVADGHVPLALATQTGGSTLRPASYCGIWGFKPTWGRVSNEGCKRYAPSLDTLGWYGRSADDLALLLDVFDAPFSQPTASAESAAFTLAGARIALCRGPLWSRAEPCMVQAMADAERLLQDAGAQVTALELPAPFETLPALQLRVMHAEGGVSLLDDYRLHGDALEASLRDQVLNAGRISHADLCAAWDSAAACRTRFDALAAGFDAVLTPSSTGVAPLGLHNTGDFAFNGLWTLLHVPCVNVPGLTGDEGLPLGLTLTGPRFADRRVLAVARALGALFALRKGRDGGRGDRPLAP